jgi:hypothetical protein
MLGRHLLVILPLAATIVACSDSPSARTRRTNPGQGGSDGQTAAPDDGAAAGDTGTSRAKKDICATLDYAHDRSNAEYFLQFDDDAAALEFSKGFLDANGISDPASLTTNARVLRLVGRVFDGFRRVFPRETEGLDKPPRVLAVQAPGINAFAGYDERNDVNKAPWLFWVHQPTIDSDKPDAELEGLYAHELAHLILRNLLPETRKKIRTHYRVLGGKEKGVIGAVAPDEANVRALAEELRDIGNLVGREPGFGALPISAYEENEYESMLATLAKDRGGGDAQACQTADNGLQQAGDFYRANVSVHDLTLSLTPKQAQDLATLANNTSDAFRKCYANVNKSLLELKINDKSARVLVNGVPASLETLLDPTTPEHELVYSVLMANQVERDVDAKTGLTTIARVLEVVDRLHQRAGELDSDASLPIDELRVFDLEEDADDAAVRILRAIGDDTLGAAKLFMGQMPDPSACQQEIESGVVPRYGRFIDSHNATCWRAFHSMDLADALSRCPATPPLSPNSSSGAAGATRGPLSPADPGPMEILRRRAQALRWR